MVVERVYRELRFARIFEGANEIQRNMLAKQLLKSWMQAPRYGQTAAACIFSSFKSFFCETST
jgi:hypothetical protein